MINNCFIDFVIEESLSLDFDIGVVTVVDADPYEGEYIVEPKTVEQKLETKHKKMKDDVTVLEIPYAETSNLYGTTVVIAS